MKTKRERELEKALQKIAAEALLGNVVNKAILRTVKQALSPPKKHTIHSFPEKKPIIYNKRRRRNEAALGVAPHD